MMLQRSFGIHSRRTDFDSHSSLVVASNQGEVSVVDAETATISWRRRTGRILGTLTQDGEHCYLALGAPLNLYTRQQRATTQDERDRIEVQLNAPARLEARSMVDGSIHWAIEDWSLTRALHVELDEGVLLAAAMSHTPGSETIYALDTRTAAIRWTTLGSPAMGYLDRLVAARGGRVYVHGATDPQRMQVRDVQSGRELWSAAWSFPWTFSSPRGALLAQPEPGYAQAGALTLLRAEDGAVVDRIPLWGWIQALTDAGMAYATFVDGPRPWLAAIDTTAAGGRELWRAEGIRADRLVVDSDRVYFARIVKPELVAEVGALDARTGAQLWSWRTPGTTEALLRLWGWRTPMVLADAAIRSWQTVAEAVGQPSPHQRRAALRQEMLRGQWRRPYALHSANNALWLRVHGARVFLGTRIGLFALDGRSGDMLWHALPTTDLSFVDPALPA